MFDLIVSGGVAVMPDMSEPADIGVAGGKAGPGRGKKTGSDTTRLGRGRGYVLARLDRDAFAELAAQVRVKTKSAAEAARQAGFQKRFTPADKVRRLLPKLTDAEWEQLKASENGRRISNGVLAG